MRDGWQWVAFDLDGTLIDSLPALQKAYHAFLQEHGARGSKEEFEHLNGPTMATIVSVLKERHRLSPPHPILLDRCRCHVEEAYRAIAEPIPGAVDLLGWTETAALGCALVTSSPRAVVAPVLGKLGWTGVFDVVVCGDEVERAKPDPELYRRAAKLGAWRAEAGVAIEDAPAGVEAAVNAGLHVIGFGPPSRWAELSGKGAQWTCSTLAAAGKLIARGKAPDGAHRRS
jgi:HAD superfamily hydrolase (TIGR01509 family)